MAQLFLTSVVSVVSVVSLVLVDLCSLTVKNKLYSAFAAASSLLSISPSCSSGTRAPMLHLCRETNDDVNNRDFAVSKGRAESAVRLGEIVGL